MRILLLTRYGRLGASSRVRSLQYLPRFEERGWKIDVSALFSDRYVIALYGGSTAYREVLWGYWRRFKVLFAARQYDLVWIEKEALPFMPAFAERLLARSGVGYIVDYDDALFHRYDQHRIWLVRVLLGRKIDTVMQHAKLVIAGNDYLAQRAFKAGAKHVEIVPTVIDLERYGVSVKSANSLLTVGWIGTPATSRYLVPLYPVFERLKQEFNVRFVAVGATPEQTKGTSVDALPWTEESEVSLIQAFDIGIMPLTDSPWERGKCGYKLIQYMACGKPVVASPVGVNKKIVREGIDGNLVQTPEQWYEALAALLSSQSKRMQMGAKAREFVKDKYSVQVQAPRLMSMISDMGLKKC